jgi:hypothetical protein
MGTIVKGNVNDKLVCLVSWNVRQVKMIEQFVRKSKWRTSWDNNGNVMQVQRSNMSIWQRNSDINKYSKSTCPNS